MIELFVKCEACGGEGRIVLIDADTTTCAKCKGDGYLPAPASAIVEFLDEARKVAELSLRIEGKKRIGEALREYDAMRGKEGGE